MPTGNQIKVATEEVAQLIAKNFSNTTWVADKLGGALVMLGFGVTVKEVNDFLNPPKKK